MKNEIPTKENGGLIGPYTFATRKKVSYNAVYDRIKSGEITTVPVGRRNLIDWKKYKHVQFPHAKNYVNKGEVANG